MSMYTEYWLSLANKINKKVYSYLDEFLKKFLLQTLCVTGINVYFKKCIKKIDIIIWFVMHTNIIQCINTFFCETNV